MSFACLDGKALWTMDATSVRENIKPESFELLSGLD